MSVNFAKYSIYVLKGINYADCVSCPSFSGLKTVDRMFQILRMLFINAVNWFAFSLQ